ncbi:DUF1014-domain-containing protein [Karstenula rhodostoma CBS 690.94]|uniref:DUF1014-domain-containing protein n=1 Tax=Karstenula rhodostoma CBS 690.94 TaxID=1392251 RepID=A0A9P4PVB0_9PLEO|nr:DUF1014-domain-containing protein [Karstenula rhodostoma CBS 690.94]
MAPKKSGGEGSKKAQGQARKADAAASKQAQKESEAAAAEAKKWDTGSKSSSKAEAATAKKEEAARKKAEKDALLKEEEASLPSKPKGAGAKKAEKKTRGIDSALGSLSATGIDNALDALSLTAQDSDKVDRHPERRYKAAYAAYEERRLEEMKDEKGLRRNQKVDQIRKEFDKHPDNPKNQAQLAFNATKEEIAEFKESERIKKEQRLGGAS